MVDLAPRKLIRMGKNSYGVTIPKEMAEKTIANGNKKIWVAVLEDHEAPSGDDVVKWIKGS